MKATICIPTVLLLEKAKGYPAHYWFAMGHR